MGVSFTLRFAPSPPRRVPTFLTQLRDPAVNQEVNREEGASSVAGFAPACSEDVSHKVTASAGGVPTISAAEEGG